LSSPESILETLNVCCVSFVNAVSESSSFLNNGASIIAITHDGANRHVQNYGVLGLRSKALSDISRSNWEKKDLELMRYQPDWFPRWLPQQYLAFAVRIAIQNYAHH